MWLTIYKTNWLLRMNTCFTLYYLLLFSPQFVGTPLVHSNRPRRVKMRCGSKPDSLREYIYIYIHFYHSRGCWNFLKDEGVMDVIWLFGSFILTKVRLIHDIALSHRELKFRLMFRALWLLISRKLNLHVLPLGCAH